MTPALIGLILITVETRWLDFPEVEVTNTTRDMIIWWLAGSYRWILVGSLVQTSREPWTLMASDTADRLYMTRI